MEIIWSPQSLEELELVGDFIALDDPLRAITFVDDVIESVDRLTKFPESGRLVEENPIFRQIIFQGYRLIYQYRNKQILIITVLGPGQIL